MSAELLKLPFHIDPLVLPPKQDSIAAYRRRLGYLAQQLLEISNKMSEPETAAEVVCVNELVKTQLIAEITFRQRRNKTFSDGLFSEPAWDILLDLTLARIEKRRISISSLCIAAAVPTTTALRWIKTLLLEGIITREADREDRRRHFVDIGDESYEKVRSLMKARAQKK